MVDAPNTIADRDEAARDLIARWTRIGAAFNSAPASTTPDLEQLLIDTVKLQPIEARTFIMALSWLCLYGQLVARHRLRSMAIALLTPAERSVLGLLLDLVQAKTETTRFRTVIAACSPRRKPAPLFAAAAADPALAERVRRRASPIAIRWNLWMEPVEPKFDAIRPWKWVFQHNLSFDWRDSFKGDLRSSILESLRTNPASGNSELALARACSATRPAVRTALARLHAAGLVERIKQGNRLSIRLKTS